MIRLMLVDGHTILRASLRALLDREPDIGVVGEAGDGETALALARKLAPDLLLMDIALPGLSGIETTLRITSESPAVKVLVLSAHTERRFVAHMLNAGASGYVSKTASTEELLLGIRTAAAGTRYLSDQVAAMLANTPPDKASQAKLGRREIAVLDLIAKGWNSPAIAKTLNIAISTVETHRSNIMQNRPAQHRRTDALRGSRRPDPARRPGVGSGAPARRVQLAGEAGLVVPSHFEQVVAAALVARGESCAVLRGLRNVGLHAL